MSKGGRRTPPPRDPGPLACGQARGPTQGRRPRATGGKREGRGPRERRAGLTGPTPGRRPEGKGGEFSTSMLRSMVVTSLAGVS